MAILTVLVLACCTIASGYQLFQLVAAHRFFRRARRADRRRAPFRPPVTILKPLKGPGLDLYANLASFCRQDYPDFQIVCGVDSADDPAVAVVERLQREFPQIDLVLSIGHEPGTNRKIANLVHMTRHAKHDVLVLSDADIRVRPDYLRSMVAPLVDPQVGLTTCLYRGRGYFGLPSVIESLLINTDSIPMFVTAEWVQGLKNAYGASIAFRREALDAIGGFPALADYLADDYLLGAWIARAGWKLELLPYVVETVLDSTTVADVWRHQVRWARTYRAQQALGWFCSVVTHAVSWGVLAVIVTGGSLVGWTALATAIACRLVGLRGIMRLLRERETPRQLWMVPLKDLGYTAIWLVSWLGRDVVWSGQVLRVRSDGSMVAVGPTERPAEAPAPLAPQIETEPAQRAAAR